MSKSSESATPGTSRRSGRLWPDEIVAPLDTYLAKKLATNLRLLSVDLSHAVAVERLPFHHQDPFDRLLVARRSVNGCRS